MLNMLHGQPSVKWMYIFTKSCYEQYKVNKCCKPMFNQDCITIISWHYVKIVYVKVPLALCKCDDYIS